MRFLMTRPGLQFLCASALCLALVRPARAQDDDPNKQSPPPKQTSTASSDDVTSGDVVTMFPHSETSRYWISGQANVIFQWHPTFPAKYSGTNSLTAQAQSATTHVLTLYTGYELTHTTEVFFDLEYASGGGIGTALGLAGYTNLDSVRAVQGVTLSKAPYMARLMLRQIIPLSKEETAEDRGPFTLATSVPVRRIEFRAGKFDLVDYIDVNRWGSDSHLQFLNWTVAQNGVYDYAANTRGYTYGVMVEYDDHWFTVRFAEALMPKVANGINLDADIARARSENLEFTATGSRFFHRPGAVRLLSYLNTANMGSYEESIREFQKNPTSPPNIIATRHQGREKYGFGLNFEQELTANIGAFGRLGWSDGHNESFAYTEDDRALETGVFFKGDWWHRRNDRAGAAFSMNGLSAAHREYLALGGLGFILGDGALTYGHEKIFEGFYTLHVWRGIFTAFDFQHINNPGDNKDRGPVTVAGVRLHVDF